MNKKRAANWDPESDSVVRALMEAIVPKGITYTNFGSGMSVDHTSFKQQSGAYTMIELPVVDMIYGDKEELIRKLV